MGGAIHEAVRQNAFAAANHNCIRLVRAHSFEMNEVQPGFGLRSASGNSGAQPYEIIVADDASTDATAEIARQNNSCVVSVNHRQIAATRNSGAKAAQGERLFFVDADSHFRQFAICHEQFSGREIIEAKLPEPGGGSIWSAAG